LQSQIKPFHRCTVCNEVIKQIDKICNLRNLRQLDLSNNELTELPRRISKLKKLQYLNLGQNNLTALPDEICNLTNLSHLYLSNNELTKLPEKIGKLKKLKSLLLSGNVFSERLPASLCELSRNVLAEITIVRGTPYPGCLRTKGVEIRVVEFVAKTKKRVYIIFWWVVTSCGEGYLLFC